MPTFRYGYTLNFPGSGGPGRSIWHFRKDGPVTTVQDCVDVIDDFVLGVIGSGLLANPVNWDGDDQAIDVATQEIIPVTGSTFTDPAGPVDFNPSSMIVCTMRTSIANKSGLGRKFIGPLKASVCDTNGTPDSGAITTLQGFCTALVSASQGLTGAAIGVYSPTYSIFRDLTVMQARDYLAVLRSRRD